MGKKPTLPAPENPDNVEEVNISKHTVSMPGENQYSYAEANHDESDEEAGGGGPGVQCRQS